LLEFLTAVSQIVVTAVDIVESVSAFQYYRLILIDGKLRNRSAATGTIEYDILFSEGQFIELH
jgi:hypothetical protein